MSLDNVNRRPAQLPTETDEEFDERDAVYAETVNVASQRLLNIRAKVESWFGSTDKSIKGFHG